MNRPEYDFEPTIPTRQSPVNGGGDCGSNWDIPFEIRAPYGKIDKFGNTLPILFANRDITNPNLSISMPVLMSENFLGKLEAGIQDARGLLYEYDGAGFIDSGSKKTIQGHIDTASDYLKKARKLVEYWEQYNPHSGKAPTGWPLTRAGFGHGCDDKVHPAQGAYYTMTKDGPGTVSFGCPTQKATNEHEYDRQMVFKLLNAAVLHARCAQEGAAFVGTYNRNKKSSSGKAADMIGYMPGAANQEAEKKMQSWSGGAVSSRPKRGEREGSMKIPDLGSGSSGGEIAEGEVSAPKKRKKDNTLLIAGAAALGLLALKK